MYIRNKYVVEVLAFVSYVLFAMAWVGATANMDQVMDDMQIETLASASLLSGVVTAAKIVGTFIAAAIAVRLGVKRAFLVSGLLIGAGLLTPYAPSYDLLLISRFVFGLGGALMIVYFNPIVLHWFSPRERPVVNGINAVAFNIGTAVVLWLIDDMNALFGGWRHTLTAFSIASIALALIWGLVDYRESATPTSAGKIAYGYLDGLKDSFNWRYALSYSGLLAFYICLFTFYPKAGIGQGTLVMGFGILGTLAGIVYSRRFPRRLPIIRWSGLAIVATVVGLTFAESEAVQTASAILLGFFMFFPVAALLTLPQELPGMTAHRITVVFSLFYSISYLFSTVILWLFGWLVDQNGGDFHPSFVMISLVSTTLFIGSFYLPETAVVSPCDDDAIGESGEQPGTL